MPFAENGSIKLYFEEKGHGQPLFLINDMLEDHLFWNVVGSELSQNFRVIVFDQRGMGQSSVPKTSFQVEDMAKDVIAIADKLDLETFDVVGDSMGAAVAQILARKFPDRINKLVLSNAYTDLSQVIKWSLEMMVEIFEENPKYAYLYKMMMPWYFSARFLERDDDPKELLESIEKRKHPLKVQGFKKLVEAACSFNSEKILKHIQAPTLVIIAEEDIYTLFKDSRQLVRLLPNHKVELLGGGHSSKMEHPNRYIEVIRNFLLES